MGVIVDLTVCVDVDGTLLFWPGDRKGRVPRPGERGHGEPPEVNQRMARQIRDWHGEGRTIVLWSMGGKAHAEFAAKTAGISGLVIPMAKPSIIVDDSHRWLDRVEKRRPA